MKKFTVYIILLLVAFGFCSNSYSMTGAKGGASGTRSVTSEQKLFKFYESHLYYYHLFTVGDVPIDLDDVPESLIVNSRIRDIESELWKNRWSYECWNILSCGRTKKVWNCTLLQFLFQRLLSLSSPKKKLYGCSLVNKLLQYKFNLDELFYESSSSNLRISVLHAAAMFGDVDLLKMVLAKQTNRDIRDSGRLTALQRLIISNNELLAAIGLCNATEEQEALNAGHVACVTQLLEAGANKDVTFVTGRLFCKRAMRAVDYTRNPAIRALLSPETIV